MILATTDGAHTWQEQYPSSTPHPLIALSFPTPTLGYGLGRVGDAQSILRTTDGGRRWEQVGTLPVTYAYPRTGSLSFVNARLGWAILGGDALDTTTDGGRTWRRIPVARLSPAHVLQGVTAVAFADARHGCLATRDLPRPIGARTTGERSGTLSPWRPALPRVRHLWQATRLEALSPLCPSTGPPPSIPSRA